MSVEQNKEITRRWYMEVWNRDDQARIPDFISDDCVHHRGTEMVRQGPAEWVKAFQRWRSAFPDLRSEIDLLVAEEDTVAAYYRFGGTHTGTFVMKGGLTVPPTGRRFDTSEVVIFRFVDGKVVESWAVWDQLERFSSWARWISQRRLSERADRKVLRREGYPRQVAGADCADLP